MKRRRTNSEKQQSGVDPHFTMSQMFETQSRVLKIEPWLDDDQIEKNGCVRDVLHKNGHVKNYIHMPNNCTVVEFQENGPLNILIDHMKNVSLESCLTLKLPSRHKTSVNADKDVIKKHTSYSYLVSSDNEDVMEGGFSEKGIPKDIHISQPEEMHISTYDVKSVDDISKLGKGFETFTTNTPVNKRAWIAAETGSYERNIQSNIVSTFHVMKQSFFESEVRCYLSSNDLATFRSTCSFIMLIVGEVPTCRINTWSNAIDMFFKSKIGYWPFPMNLNVQSDILSCMLTRRNSLWSGHTYSDDDETFRETADRTMHNKIQQKLLSTKSNVRVPVSKIFIGTPRNVRYIQTTLGKSHDWDWGWVQNMMLVEIDFMNIGNLWLDSRTLAQFPGTVKILRAGVKMVEYNKCESENDTIDNPSERYVLIPDVMKNLSSAMNGNLKVFETKTCKQNLYWLWLPFSLTKVIFRHDMYVGADDGGTSSPSNMYSDSESETSVESETEEVDSGNYSSGGDEENQALLNSGEEEEHEEGTDIPDEYIDDSDESPKTPPRDEPLMSIVLPKSVTDNENIEMIGLQYPTQQNPSHSSAELSIPSFPTQTAWFPNLRHLDLWWLDIDSSESLKNLISRLEQCKFLSILKLSIVKKFSILSDLKVQPSVTDFHLKTPYLTGLYNPLSSENKLLTSYLLDLFEHRLHSRIQHLTIVSRGEFVWSWELSHALPSELQTFTIDSIVMQYDAFSELPSYLKMVHVVIFQQQAHVLNLLPESVTHVSIDLMDFSNHYRWNKKRDISDEVDPKVFTMKIVPIAVLEPCGSPPKRTGDNNSSRNKSSSGDSAQDETIPNTFMCRFRLSQNVDQFDVRFLSHSAWHYEDVDQFTSLPKGLFHMKLVYQYHEKKSVIELGDRIRVLYPNISIGYGLSSGCRFDYNNIHPRTQTFSTMKPKHRDD